MIVLALLGAAAANRMEAVGVRIGISLAFALPTVNGPERSVSRESVAAAKRKATAQASMTRCRLSSRKSISANGTEHATEQDPNRRD
jgi:hypothetical protein